MNVLSLFDGMSCGQIALNKIGINYDHYYASEIEKNAIKITMNNYQNTKQLGDIRYIKNIKNIDLLIGGSPCQGFSFSGNRLNFDDSRSKLFFEYLRILQETKPKYFLLENVRMNQRSEDVITNALGIKPVKINSSLLSAQSRNRLYWTNIPFEPIQQKHVVIKDILEQYIDTDISDEEITSQLRQLLKTSIYVNSFQWKKDTQGRILVMRPDGLKIQRIGRVAFGQHKSEILTVLTQPFVFDGINIRKVTPVEAERLQTVPDNYTFGVSDAQRYKMLGNGWTVDIIAHILKGIK